MILVVNGDGHAAGAYAVNDFLYSADDPEMHVVGPSLHPDNLSVSWSAQLSEILRMKLVNLSPNTSNEKIIDSTEKWIDSVSEVMSPSDIFIVIGWSDESPILIRNYHLYLKEAGIKHLFFSTTKNIELEFTFNSAYCNDAFIPYIQSLKYGFISEIKPYFKSEAHAIWASYLTKHIVKHNII